MLFRSQVIQATKSSGSEIITYSWLTPSDISSIEWQVFFRNFLDLLGLDDYIDLALVIFILFIIPVTTSMFKKHVTQSDWWTKREAKNQHRTILKQNMKANKEFAKMIHV